MTEALIHGRYLITNDPNLDEPVVQNGALFQENGRIIAIGTYTDLKRAYPDAEEFGGSDFVVFPGFINAHHHGSGLSASQQGLPEGNLEPKLFKGMGRTRPDPYLNTLYACAKMIESGVTCSLHHAYAGGDPEAYLTAMEGALRAHEKAGMRVAIAIAARDQNSFAYEADEQFIQRLPKDLRQRAEEFLVDRDIPVDEYLAIFRELHARYRNSDRVRVLLGPAGLQWCSDTLLRRIVEQATTANAGIHLHAVESIYQKLYAERSLGCSAVEHLHDLGVLGPRTSCAHSIWATETDLELLATTGTSVVHNPSSNLRSGCGIAPVIAMWARGVNVALGMDGSTLNDDDDMLQEMRLCLRLHRQRGLGRAALSPEQVFAMATSNAAQVALFDGTIGQLAAGKRADLVLMKMDTTDSATVVERLGAVAALLARGKANDIDTVMIDGRVVMRDGQLTVIDKQALLSELRRWVTRELPPSEKARMNFITALEEHMLAFYEQWKPDRGQPYYILNSRV